MRCKRPPQVGTIGSTIAAGLDIAMCCEAGRSTSRRRRASSARSPRRRFRRPRPVQEVSTSPIDARPEPPAITIDTVPVGQGDDSTDEKGPLRRARKAAGICFDSAQRAELS